MCKHRHLFVLFSIPPIAYNETIMVHDPKEIVLEHLRAIRRDLDALKKLPGEMREGFASVRAHQAATHGD
jgi:hypothetical protein